MQNEESEIVCNCKRCGKPLKNEKSQKRGYGKTFFAKVSLEK